MMNEPVNKMELSEQNAILQKAKITKGDLPELLEKKGISYDALRYEEYCDLPQECLSPIEIILYLQKMSGVKLGNKRLSYFGRLLQKNKYPSRRTKRGTCYFVVKIG